MTFDWAEWGPPLVIIGLGILAGIATMSRFRRDDKAAEDQGARDDLDRSRDEAVAALKSLELEAHKLAPADYQRERESLLARGAGALRAMDEQGATDDPGFAALVDRLRQERQTAGPHAFARAMAEVTGTGPRGGMVAPEWKGVFATLAVVALVAVLVVAAQSESVNRRSGASMTGNQSLGGDGEMAAPPSATPMDQQIEAALDANPDDLDALNMATRMALGRGDAPGAMQYNQRVLTIDPNDADGRTYKAVLAAMVGMTDRAWDGLEAVLADHPDHLRAITYKGLIAIELGRFDEAVPLLERAVAASPGDMALAEALQRAKAGGGAAPPPPAPSAGTVVAAGRATLQDGVTLTGNEIVFISARDPAGGPPLAAMRLAPNFPLDFQMTTADAIAMGGAPRPFPATFVLAIKVDKDGSPGGEVAAEVVISDFTNGTQDLDLVLAP